MGKSKFSRDLTSLLKTLKNGTGPEVMQQLHDLRKTLVGLNQRRLVKINHSVMEIICAKHLIEQGYNVNVEHLLDGGVLVADIFCTHSEIGPTEKTTETLIVEVETGYVPPDAALSPRFYRQARITAKIARYCLYADKFALATPNYHVLQIPEVLLKPPEQREQEDMLRLKILCDFHYHSPAIPLDHLNKSELDIIYVIDVDNGNVVEIPPRNYIDTIRRADGSLQD